MLSHGFHRGIGLARKNFHIADHHSSRTGLNVKFEIRPETKWRDRSRAEAGRPHRPLLPSVG